MEKFLIRIFNDSDVLFSNETRKLGKSNSECFFQESNLFFSFSFRDYKAPKRIEFRTIKLSP